jgi:DNA-binding CsgD family transcriptional regulator
LFPENVGGDLSPSSCTELIDAARNAGSVEEVHGLCSELCDRAGFDFFIYGAVLPVSLVRPQTLIISGYPSDWWGHYQDRGYFTIDPVVRHTTSSHTVPLVWNDIDPESNPHADLVREFMSEAADFGLVSGVSFPVHGQQGETAILSLASREYHVRACARIVRVMPIGQLLAGYIHEAALRVFCEGKVLLHRPDLTERERECLLWAAEGKTSWDISQILGISERTVLFHLQNAAQKLNVSNRAQAVARAVAQGYVVPQFR